MMIRSLHQPIQIKCLLKQNLTEIAVKSASSLDTEVKNATRKSVSNVESLAILLNSAGTVTTVNDTVTRATNAGSVITVESTDTRPTAVVAVPSATSTVTPRITARHPSALFVEKWGTLQKFADGNKSAANVLILAIQKIAVQRSLGARFARKSITSDNASGSPSMSVVFVEN